MDAECRVLGTLMLLGADGSARSFMPLMVPLWGFQSSFHASVFLEVMRLQKLGEPCDPLTVWDAVKRHQDAQDFGLAHLADLVAEAASPETLGLDCAMLVEWAALKAGTMSGMLH